MTRYPIIGFSLEVDDEASLYDYVSQLRDGQARNNANGRVPILL